MAAVPTHGMSGSYTYRRWQCMRMRCRYFLTYVKRGITVCERWEKFENFYADVGEIPEGMSLDRIDNDRGYEPGNIRFATSKQQARNRSSNTHVTIAGVTKTPAEWAEEAGLPPNTLLNRVKAGWPEHLLLWSANSTRNVLLTIDGRTQPLTEWAKERGIKKSCLSKRVKAGWPPELCVIPPLAKGKRVLRSRKKKKTQKTLPFKD